MPEPMGLGGLLWNIGYGISGVWDYFSVRRMERWCERNKHYPGVSECCECFENSAAVGFGFSAFGALIGLLFPFPNLIGAVSGFFLGFTAVNFLYVSRVKKCLKKKGIVYHGNETLPAK